MYKKLLLIATIVALWQISYTVFNIENSIVPPPLELFETFIHAFSDGEITKHSIASLRRVIVGFSIAASVGVSLGLLLGYYKKAGEYFLPLIEVLRPIPPIAWIPIAIIIFGLGDQSAYFIVFTGAFFPIFSNTYFGVTSLPNIFKNVALTFEISKTEFFKRILFYSALPFIFTGLKIGIGMAWMSVIAAELIGAQSGLGYYIQMNRLTLRTDKMIVGIILIGVLGYLLNQIILNIEKKAIPWRSNQ